MAEATLSSTEATLENQRLGPLQIRVAALCTLVQICDGYDINSIGVAVPQLTHAWNLPGPAFTTAFVWSSIGILVGALSSGPIGGFVCGQIAGLLLPSFGWPGIFIVGGIVPLLILVALVLWLPESPRFLAAKASLSPRETALLQRLNVRPGQSAAALDLANG